jgi:hypothetical protein
MGRRIPKGASATPCVVYAVPRNSVIPVVGRMKCNGTQRSGPRHDVEDLNKYVACSKNK